MYNYNLAYEFTQTRITMNKEELGKILHDMYFNSPEGETVAMIHLFGIQYA